MAYVATNVDVGFIGHFLAFDSTTECEKYLVGKLACTVVPSGEKDGHNKLMCKESLPALKKAPLKLKEKMK